MINGVPDAMQIRVFDKDTWTKDDFICETSVNVNNMMQRNTGTEWYPLYRKGRDAGQVCISWEFRGGNAVGGGGYSMPMQQSMYGM